MHINVTKRFLTKYTVFYLINKVTYNLTFFLLLSTTSDKIYSCIHKEKFKNRNFQETDILRIAGVPL